MSLIEPGNATISIVPAITLQEKGRLVFTAQQRVRRLYRHGSGGSGNSP